VSSIFDTLIVTMPEPILSAGPAKIPAYQWQKAQVEHSV